MMLSTARTPLGLSLSAGLLALTLSGCGTLPIKASLDLWCDTNHPEEPTRAQYATYSHDQKVNMADHNDFGAKHCGWKPPGR